MQPSYALSTLILLAQLASGPVVAQGFKFSQPDESDRIEQEARQSQIAEQLSTSREDVRSYLEQIYNKLGASDRTAAVAEALRRRLID